MPIPERVVCNKDDSKMNIFKRLTTIIAMRPVIKKPLKLEKSFLDDIAYILSPPNINAVDRKAVIIEDGEVFNAKPIRGPIEKPVINPKPAITGYDNDLTWASD